MKSIDLNSKQIMKKRTLFSKEDDKKLRDLVDKHGTENWEKISSEFDSKSATDCRTRFQNYLVPYSATLAWTKEEDTRLIEKFEEIGPRWKILSSFFPGRSFMQIKSHFFAITKGQDRERLYKPPEQKTEVDLKSTYRLPPTIPKVYKPNKVIQSISAPDTNND